MVVMGRSRALSLGDFCPNSYDYYWKIESEAASIGAVFHEYFRRLPTPCNNTVIPVQNLRQLDKCLCSRLPFCSH